MPEYKAQSLGGDFLALQAAEIRFANELRRLLALAGLNVSSLEREGSEWSLRLSAAEEAAADARPRDLQAPNTASEPLGRASDSVEDVRSASGDDELMELESLPASTAAVAQALPPFEDDDDAPAEPASSDPAKDAEPLIAQEGEDLVDLIGRESEALLVHPIGEAAGRLTIPLLSDDERVRLQAITMVGDVLLNLHVMGLAPHSPEAHEAMLVARHAYEADGGTLAWFDKIIEEHAQGAFAGLSDR